MITNREHCTLKLSWTIIFEIVQIQKNEEKVVEDIFEIIWIVVILYINGQRTFGISKQVSHDDVVKIDLVVVCTIIRIVTIYPVSNSVVIISIFNVY